MHRLDLRARANPLTIVLGFALSLCGFLLASAAQVFAQSAPSETLTTAAAVRALSVEEAREQKPVRLRGVVTFFNESLFSRFIQDDTAGIYLQYSTNTPTPQLFPGQLVEVEGTSSPGEYAPVVVPDRIKIVGNSALPTPKPVTYERLAAGREDSQFVEIAGIVRSVQLNAASQCFLVEIATGGGHLLAYVPALPVERTGELIDSTVRVRGVCTTQFNHQRQLFAIRLMVPRPEDLVIEERAPADPFATPARPIGSLLQFTPQESFGHRVKVSGTVIYFDPGRELFLQDGDQGIDVQTASLEPLQLGDRVEALGFVGQGQYTPVLQDAVYRRITNGMPIEPVTLTHDEALKGNHDCQLIRIAARLLDRAVHGSERYLILQDNDFIFHAYLRPHDGEDVFGGLQNGSRIAVTGVCRIDPGKWQAGEDWRARAFQVDMRSVADVTVLEAPPWWTLGKVLWIAGVLGFVALAASAWIMVLHRQVAERTHQLEMQIQERQRAERRREIEQERTRVAQDLHDELGATLTEVSMLSSLAGTPSLPPENRNRYLTQLAGAARAVVTTLDEIVWAVNPKYDSVAALASYYSLFAQRFLNLAGIACRLRVAEAFPEVPMDSRLRHGVFLAFKEALNNAVVHSGATEVRVEMLMDGRQLVIIVADNGRGFGGGPALPGSDGLASMRARMERLGGACHVQSAPGRGTTIEFRQPFGDQSS
jgi:signal transduction histidine kinase